MNAKTWGPLVAAIVMGLFAAKLGRDMLSRRSPEKAAAAAVARIVVAKDDIAPGATLKATDLSLKTVQEKDALPGAFHTVEEVVGRVTSVGLKKERPIFDDALAPVGSGSGLTAIVPDGMRAVTVDVNEVSGVAGLLVPGCRIDMVETLAGDDGQLMARTIARDLLIIAIGRRFSPGKEDAPDAPVARTVTLLVTPKEAEVIDLAAHTGNPRLLLRGSRDSHNASGTDGVTVGELRNGMSDGGWISAFARFLAPAMKAIVQLPPVRPQVTAAAQPPATQPAQKPGRQVTVIRRTQEAAVQLEATPELKKQAVVDTDQTEVPGTNKHD